MAVHENAESTVALAKLGITEEILAEAIRRGEGARNSATLNHPPNAAGILAWVETTRALRDLGQQLGCTRDDGHNFSRLVLPGGKDAIAVTTGDMYTADPEHEPQPKRPRGTAAQAAVSTQSQMVFPIVQAIEAVDAANNKKGPRIWFLLVRRNGHKAVAELSLPSSITDAGRVASWHERIILNAVDATPTPLVQTGPEFTPPVDFDLDRLG